MTFEILFSLIRKKRKLILTHACIWALFIGYEISFVYLTGAKLSGISNYVTAYLLNIISFYFNVWCLHYSFTEKKKGYVYVILLIFEIAAYLIFKILISIWLMSWKITLLSISSHVYYILSLYRLFYFLGFSSAYWSVLLLLRSTTLVNKMESRHLIQQKRSAELERNLFKAKNAYLTSQINPHLLFNTLNFIYSNLYDVSKKAAETVLLLSDMMRYSLTEIGDDGKVELSQEIEHIENMIQLNQARFNDKLQIKLYLNGEFEVRIIPLILLTFIENIFKHGDLTNPQSPAQININYYHNVLEFYSTNKIRKANISRGNNIGIENSKTRLDAAYQNRYTLITKAEGDQFITKLSIRFQN